MLKLVLIGLVAGLAPLVLFIGDTSREVVSGEVTSYSYLNVAAIIGGVLAVGCALLLIKLIRTALTMLLFVGLILLGGFQVVRGAGLLPDITNCESDTYKSLCTYTGD